MRSSTSIRPQKFCEVGQAGGAEGAEGAGGEETLCFQGTPRKINVVEY